MLGLIFFLCSLLWGINFYNKWTLQLDFRTDSVQFSWTPLASWRLPSYHCCYRARFLVGLNSHFPPSPQENSPKFVSLLANPVAVLITWSLSPGYLSWSYLILCLASPKVVNVTSAEGQDYLLLSLFSVSELLLVLTEASSKSCACSLHATSDRSSVSTWSVAFHRQRGKWSIQGSDTVTDQIFNANPAPHIF